jgi:predicted RNA-binding protein YlqC (UPF0109 family)
MGIFGVNSSESAAAKDQPSGLKDLEHFVDYIVRALVDNPEDVRIKYEKEENTNIIRIDCKKEDVGKIVGKRGKTIMAIRSLVNGAAGRIQQRVTVEVTD